MGGNGEALSCIQMCVFSIYSKLWEGREKNHITDIAIQMAKLPTGYKELPCGKLVISIGSW